MKGESAAVTDPDGDWQSLTNMDSSQGPGRFMVGMVRNFKAPAAQATDLAAAGKGTQEGRRRLFRRPDRSRREELLTFRRGGGATVTNPTGSAKFWLKDGVLTKYEFKVKGSVSFNGNDMDVDRDTTVEIKDVGTTKVDVPDEAKKVL